MVRSAIAHAERATLIVVSHLFAINRRRNICSSSERDVAVLLRLSAFSFRSEHGERVDHAGPCLRRFDYVVEVSHPGGDVWVRKAIAVLAHELLLPPLRVLRLLDFLLEDDRDRAFRTHDRELGRRPSEVEVPADVLRTHDVVRAAVRFPRDDRDLRDGRLTESKPELRTVSDNRVVLWLLPWKKSRNVDEREEGDVEAVAEPNEPRSFDRGIDVERARLNFRLIPDDADRSPLEASKAHDDILGPFFMDLEPRVAVDDPPDDVSHVIWFVGLLRDHLRKFRVRSGRLVVGGDNRRIVHVIRR